MKNHAAPVSLGGARAVRQRTVDKLKAKARRYDSIGHLGPEAVVAFVDGEMGPKSQHRVRVHLVHCPECRGEIERQRGAAEWVRQRSEDVHIPQSLVARLTNIASSPQCAGPNGEELACTPKQDFLDKLDTLRRAIRR